jgi:hypothetical protein
MDHGLNPVTRKMLPQAVTFRMLYDIEMVDVS